MSQWFITDKLMVICHKRRLTFLKIVISVLIAVANSLFNSISGMECFFKTIGHFFQNQTEEITAEDNSPPRDFTFKNIRNTKQICGTENSHACHTSGEQII